MGRFCRHQVCRRDLQDSPGERGRVAWAELALSVLVLVMASAWAYSSTLSDLLRTWQTSEDYSAGQLVPLVVLFLIWRDRKMLSKLPLAPCWLGGIALILFAHAMRILALLFVFLSGRPHTLVLTVGGLVLMVAGWQVFRRLCWVWMFLFLMPPLPGAVHRMISGPLQRLATTGSVFLLQAFRIPVRQEGNVVTLADNIPMAVAEACSGLRMLMAFVIIGAFIAFMIKRPRWQKAVVLASSIPVAVVCNLLRIVVTAVLILYVGRELGETFFHDLAGYFMTAVAVLLLFGEISLMDRLILPAPAPAGKEPVRRSAPKPAGRQERQKAAPEAEIVFRRRRPAESTG